MKYLIIAALSYASFQIMAAIAARRLSSSLFLIAGTASVMFFTVILTFLTGGHKNIGDFDTKGLVLVFLANGCITLFALFLAKSFQAYDAQFAIPMIFGGAILVSTVASLAINKHSPTLYEAISLLLVAGGLLMYAIQPKA